MNLVDWLFTFLGAVTADQRFTITLLLIFIAPIYIFYKLWTSKEKDEIKVKDQEIKEQRQQINDLLKQLEWQRKSSDDIMGQKVVADGLAADANRIIHDYNGTLLALVAHVSSYRPPSPAQSFEESSKKYRQATEEFKFSEKE